MIQKNGTGEKAGCRKQIKRGASGELAFGRKHIRLGTRTFRGSALREKRADGVGGNG